MIWSALLIPLLISIIGVLFFHKKLVWWEVILGSAVSVIFIIASYYTMKSVSLSDTEYNGYNIVQARYYESYETWVRKTCTRTTKVGKTTVTTTYDCSYCDYVSERYVLIDDGGNEFSINQATYNNFVKLWNHKRPQFVELNRDINYHFGCGKDGDMYQVTWNGQMINSVASTVPHSFTNILKTNHSAFNFPVITDQQAKNKSLFQYPDINNYYQPTVLGIDNLSISSKTKRYITKTIDYTNGTLGHKNKVRVYILLFKNKPIDIATLQQAYWDGGNQNEIVICIGVDNKANINWVKPFSWCKDKTLLVNLREDIIKYKSLSNIKAIDKVIVDNITTLFKYRDFEDFNYLSFEPTINQILLVYILTTIISIGILMWSIKNEYE